jgi:XTP/dITP diphosphohydrolase
MAELVLATRNQGKKREFDALVRGLGIRLRSLDEFEGAPDPEETGATFEANALLKARSAADATGLWVLADDSGLCVDALGGAPGVQSARYAEGSDRTRWQKLLEALDGVPEGERQAAFVCVLALVGPSGETAVAEGRCEGAIARAPRGEAGFGYDPVFLVAGDPEARTMAELTTEEKGIVSHRGRAFDRLRPELVRLLGARTGG